MKKVSQCEELRREKIAKGLCSQCGLEPLVNARYCVECRRRFRIRERNYMRRRFGYKPWRPGGPGRPPIEVLA